MRGSNLPPNGRNGIANRRFQLSPSNGGKLCFSAIIAVCAFAISSSAPLISAAAERPCGSMIVDLCRHGASSRFDRSNYAAPSGRFAGVEEAWLQGKAKKHGWHAAPPRMPPRRPLAQNNQLLAPPMPRPLMPPRREPLVQAAPPRIPPSSDSQGVETPTTPPPREPIGGAGPPRMPPPEEPQDTSPSPPSPEPSPPPR